MSALELMQVWMAGTVIVSLLAGMCVLLANRDGYIEVRRFFARIVLASPVWPLLILAVVGYVLLALVRWAR